MNSQELELLEHRPIREFIARPIEARVFAAFGNSDGDLQMSQWTAAGPGPRFCLVVHHTDAQREWAYTPHIASRSRLNSKSRRLQLHTTSIGV